MCYTSVVILFLHNFEVLTRDNDWCRQIVSLSKLSFQSVICSAAVNFSLPFNTKGCVVDFLAKKKRQK